MNGEGRDVKSTELLPLKNECLPVGLSVVMWRCSPGRQGNGCVSCWKREGKCCWYSF